MASTRTGPRRPGSEDLRATSARYDSTNQRIIVELKNGFLVGIPLARFPEIANARHAQLAEVEVLGAGNILHWECLDADYSVPALVVAAMGRTQAARALGRTGGKSMSEAKGAAARTNGAKGGRPRKNVKTTRGGR
jgi:hypothetical protein